MKWLKPGEEAQCKKCGLRVVVPGEQVEQGNCGPGASNPFLDALKGLFLSLGLLGVGVLFAVMTGAVLRTSVVMVGLIVLGAAGCIHGLLRLLGLGLQRFRRLRTTGRALQSPWSVVVVFAVPAALGAVCGVYQLRMMNRRLYSRPPPSAGQLAVEAGRYERDAWSLRVFCDSVRQHCVGLVGSADVANKVAGLDSLASEITRRAELLKSRPSGSHALAANRVHRRLMRDARQLRNAVRRSMRRPSIYVPSQ